MLLTAIVVHVSQSSSAVLPAVGAFFSAVAAVAAFLSVRVARRSQREAERPQLAFRVVGRDADSSTELLIENVGQGVGLFVGFLILSGDGSASKGYVAPPSNLWPRTLARVDLPFLTVDGALGIVWCADRRGNVHAWNAGHRYEYYPKRKIKRDVANVFHDLYGEADLSTITYLAATPKP